MNDTLSNWDDWNVVDPKNLPIIIFGGDKASYNDEFDTRNKFVRLIKVYDLPPVFRIESLDGKFQIDRCFPLRYRLASSDEIELIKKQEGFFTEKDFTVILNKVELEVGMEVTIFPNKRGKIIGLKGNMGEDYCLVELVEPDELGNNYIEILKSSFNYLTYPE
jgi:hypothetical protein